MDQKIQENARLLESLDRIDRHIESLNEEKKIMTAVTGAILGKTGTLTTSSGISAQEEVMVPKEPDIPLS